MDFFAIHLCKKRGDFCKVILKQPKQKIKKLTLWDFFVEILFQMFKTKFTRRSKKSATIFFEFSAIKIGVARKAVAKLFSSNLEVHSRTKNL